MKTSVRVIAGLALLGVACGSGPVGGTESGNPINPPTPPAQHESAPAAHIASELDEEFADIGEPPPDEPPPEFPVFPSDHADPPEMDDVSEPSDEPAFEPIPSEPPEVEDPEPPSAAPSTPPPTQTAPPGDVGGAPASGGPGSMPDVATPGAPSGDPSDAPGSADGGGGGFGSPAACDPMACLAEAEAVAASLSGPMMPPAAYTSAICGDDQGASVCSCEGNGETVHLSTGNGAECSVSGRFEACLFDSSEFMGCQPEGDECTAVCAQVFERLTEDAAREVDVSVRGASCASTDQCLFVLAADTQCLLGPDLTTVDCSLSDEELLAMEP